MDSKPSHPHRKLRLLRYEISSVVMDLREVSPKQRRPRTGAAHYRNQHCLYFASILRKIQKLFVETEDVREYKRTDAHHFF